MLCWLVAFLRSCCRLGLLVGLLLAFACFPARVVLCCALLSVVIWCTRVIIRCNRFSVLGGIWFHLVRSCAIVARFISVYYVFG